jgi:inosine-uridine nucleoside N-ribohydrolase
LFNPLDADDRIKGKQFERICKWWRTRAKWWRTRAATVDVELTGTLTRGMTVTDWSGRWG